MYTCLFTFWVDWSRADYDKKVNKHHEVEKAKEENIRRTNKKYVMLGAGLDFIWEQNHVITALSMH